MNLDINNGGRHFGSRFPSFLCQGFQIFLCVEMMPYHQFLQWEQFLFSFACVSTVIGFVFNPEEEDAENVQEHQ